MLEKLADPATRIVSLTVTEGGYTVHPVTGAFDETDPAVQRDPADGAVCRTVFGLVVEGLPRRRDRGIPPFTVMSCDNIQGNGDVARAMFGAYAMLKDPDLGAWVASEVLLTYMHDEAEPTLEPVPRIDLDAYQHELITRSSNASVRDTVARPCAESSDRIPKWLLPVIRAQLASGGPVGRAVAIVASWGDTARPSTNRRAHHDRRPPGGLADSDRPPAAGGAAGVRGEPGTVR